MSEINFKRDYGHHDGSPFHMVLTTAEGAEINSEADLRGPFATLDLAVEDAAIYAQKFPGQNAYVLSPVRVVRTSRDLIGEYFEPTRAPREPVIEEAPPEPASSAAE